MTTIPTPVPPRAVYSKKHNVLAEGVQRIIEMYQGYGFAGVDARATVKLLNDALIKAGFLPVDTDTYDRD